MRLIIIFASFDEFVACQAAASFCSLLILAPILFAVQGGLVAELMMHPPRQPKRIRAAREPARIQGCTGCRLLGLTAEMRILDARYRIGWSSEGASGDPHPSCILRASLVENLCCS